MPAGRISDRLYFQGMRAIATLSYKFTCARCVSSFGCVGIQASEVRLNVDLDAALTVIANGCYRWLASQLRGYEKAAPKQLYRRFVETGGTVLIQKERITVTLDRRSHNPVLREAALDRDQTPIPWLGNRRLVFAFR